MKQVGYAVTIEDFNFRTEVWYDENEDHDEDRAIEWVIGNMMSEIEAKLKRQMYAEEIEEG